VSDRDAEAVGLSKQVHQLQRRAEQAVIGSVFVTKVQLFTRKKIFPTIKFIKHDDFHGNNDELVNKLLELVQFNPVNPSQNKLAYTNALKSVVRDAMSSRRGYCKRSIKKYLCGTYICYAGGSSTYILCSHNY
jgi:hypothetical protein